MKARIWCRKHKRWHSQHAAHHCRTGECTPRLTEYPIAVFTDSKRFELVARRCPVDVGSVYR